MRAHTAQHKQKSGQLRPYESSYGPTKQREVQVQAEQSLIWPYNQAGWEFVRPTKAEEVQVHGKIRPDENSFGPPQVHAGLCQGATKKALFVINDIMNYDEFLRTFIS